MAHRVLVIGVGSIGERHLRCFLASGRAQVSFVEPNESLRAEISARYPAAKVINRIEDAEIDAAVIATPAPLHVPLATTIVKRRIHVLIEKPLAVSQDGVAELIAAARDNSAISSPDLISRAVNIT